MLRWALILSVFVFCMVPIVGIAAALKRRARRERSRVWTVVAATWVLWNAVSALGLSVVDNVSAVREIGMSESADRITPMTSDSGAKYVATDGQVWLKHRGRFFRVDPARLDEAYGELGEGTRPATAPEVRERLRTKASEARRPGAWEVVVSWVLFAIAGFWLWLCVDGNRRAGAVVASTGGGEGHT
jgi:hypothetical protein